MFKSLNETLEAYQKRDPAARSKLEVFLLYPGVHATIYHRMAHWCFHHHLKFLARVISQWSRFWTGIEIHPGAKIGKGLLIDHGSGVVIGETAVVGDNCTIYQGVTLGGTGKDVGKRHPTIGNNVMIGAGAKVLGPFKVGNNSKIAAGAVVLNEIPPDSTAVGVPARIISKKKSAKCTDSLDQVHIPDPVAQEICKLRAEIEALEKRIKELEK